MRTKSLFTSYCGLLHLLYLNPFPVPPQCTSLSECHGNVCRTLHGLQN